MPAFQRAPTDFGAPSLYDAIIASGASTGLKFVGDVGGQNSYNPLQSDPQKWLDLSANAQDFYRGSSGSTESSDPVFSGNAGGLSLNEKWSFDGTQLFTVVGGANPSWVDALHKSGAVWGYLHLGYVPGFVVSLGSCTPTGGANTGVNAQSNAGGIRLSVWNAGSLVIDANAATALVNLGAQNIWGCVVNGAAGAGGAFFYANGITETFNDTYSSPSASAASHLFNIGASGTNTTGAGAEMSAIAIWQGTAPTSSQFNTIRTAMRGRLGI